MDSAYHKIETLFERDEATHRLKPELILKNPIYGDIKTWMFSEKIDGTNIRCIWTPSTTERDFGGAITTPSELTFGGKTDNAQIHADLIKWLYENISKENLQAIFPDTSVVIYGEGYGAGIQKGGGDYSPVKKLIVFDVFVVDPINSRLGGWWLNEENVMDVCAKLGLDMVPSIGEMTLEQVTAMVRAGFPSKLNGGKHQAEGIVGRTREALFDKKGHRLIIKLKFRDF